jgi:hypothetical protein
MEDTMKDDKKGKIGQLRLFDTPPMIYVSFIYCLFASLGFWFFLVFGSLYLISLTLSPQHYEDILTTYYIVYRAEEI